MSTLLIVESPNKAKVIGAMLGSEYTVVATGGHIRDLPKKRMGISDNYLPEYTVKRKKVEYLKSALSRCSDVVIGTDLDREGEAIAWHIEQVLNLQNAKRITFSEISEDAIRTALKNPRGIDYKMVKAQEARRVIDRLVGYTVSPVLAQILGVNASAGRVQSVANTLVVQREEAIANFNVTDHYGCEAVFPYPDPDSKLFTAVWDSSSLLEKEEKDYFTDRGFVDHLIQHKEFEVLNVTHKGKKSNAPPPFITSTFLQAVSVREKMSPTHAMKVLSNLYEAKLVTYPRTDAPFISPEAREMAYQYLRDHGLPDTIPNTPNLFRSSKSSQEAHHAIRPTTFAVPSLKLMDGVAGLTSDNLRVYALVHSRTLASQMTPKTYMATVLTLRTVDEVEGCGRQIFKAKGYLNVLDGWTSVFPSSKRFDLVLPVFEDGEIITAHKSEVLEKKTSPPSRFTEATIIKELEKEEVGRPSTYASTVSLIIDRKFEKVLPNRTLQPTKLGVDVHKITSSNFQFGQVEFTRLVEAELDSICCGDLQFADVVSAVDSVLQIEIKKLAESMGRDDSPQCPEEECDGYLVRRAVKSKKNTFFWGCSKFPKCTYSLPDNNGVPGKSQEKKQVVVSEEHFCKKCGCGLVLRHGKNPFWGCSGFPKCKFTTQDDHGTPMAPQICPECGENLFRCMAKRGPKKGKYFWSCSGYKKKSCSFSANDNNGKPDLGKYR